MGCLVSNSIESHAIEAREVFSRVPLEDTIASLDAPILGIGAVRFQLFLCDSHLYSPLVDDWIRAVMARLWPTLLTPPRCTANHNSKSPALELIPYIICFLSVETRTYLARIDLNVTNVGH